VSAYAACKGVGCACACECVFVFVVEWWVGLEQAVAIVTMRSRVFVCSAVYLIVAVRVCSRTWRFHLCSCAALRVFMESRHNT